MEACTSSQTLCLSCGFCCDGTLFSSVPVGAADAWAPLQAAGIEIRTTGPKPSFAQPCGAHHLGRCQVYEHRPANCQTYRCELLKKCERGDVSWHEAQQRIERVKALKSSLAAEFDRIVPEAGPWPAAIVSSLVPTLSDFGTDRELLKTWAPVLLLTAALRDTLQRHFRRPRKEGDQTGGNVPISREAAS
jgi:uncharacterized protein